MKYEIPRKPRRSRLSSQKSDSRGKGEEARQRKFADAISRLAARRMPFYPTLGSLVSRDYQAWPLQEYKTPNHAIHYD